jgi:hypothetical protein
MAVDRTRAEVADIISAFVRGDGSAWAWDDFISVRINDPALEAIRAQCAGLPDDYPPSVASHYCGEAGVAILRSLAEYLRRAVV